MLIVFKGALVGGLATFAFTNWMNIGAFISNPHREILNTTVTNCTLAVNTTIAPLPTNPYVFHREVNYIS